MTVRLAAMAFVLLVFDACAPAAAPDDSPIAVLHQRQCGRCHSPPAQGVHPRAYLEEAISRHAKRVRLTADERAEMIDYLAASQAKR